MPAGSNCTSTRSHLIHSSSDFLLPRRIVRVRADYSRYLICLTIGPAFLAAAIYLCLGRIVVVYGLDVSRVKPRTYSILFITCDFLSLALQAAGGALAATADTRADSDIGVNVMARVSRSWQIGQMLIVNRLRVSPPRSCRCFSSWYLAPSSHGVCGRRLISMSALRACALQRCGSSFSSVCPLATDQHDR